MKKFPSIEQFRNIVKTVRTNHDFQGKDDSGNNVYRNVTPYPTLTFKGSIKLHGTNGGVVRYKDGRTVFQSRERELSITSDNVGFYTHMAGLDLSPLFEGIEFNDYIGIYGEWCGGNIQKGVGINGLPKMFVIFAVCVDGEWLTDFKRDLKDYNIFNIESFEGFEIKIDFNNPELVQNTIIEWTLKVEEECPVAKHFGVNRGVGEGIVFQCLEKPELKFKSKGEKHSSSKVKVLNSVNVEELNSINAFVEYACTDNRLTQGLENVPEIDPKYTGDYIRWISNDIIKEESDTLLENKIEWKKVAGFVAKKSREFFLSKV